MNHAHAFLLMITLSAIACGGSSDSGSDAGIGWTPGSTSTEPANKLETGGSPSTNSLGITGGMYASTPSGYGGAQSTGGATGGYVYSGGNRATGGYNATGGYSYTGGARATGGSSATVGTTASNCNSLVNSGPVVTEIYLAEDPPQPTGGTIANGTYYLTSMLRYVGSAGSTTPAYNMTAKYTVAMSGCSSGGCDLQLIAHVTVEDVSISIEGNAIFVTHDTSYTSQFTCATAETTPGASAGYTATANELTLFSEDGTSATTYTRQLF